MSAPVRALVTVLGLDQHEAGSLAVARLLRDAGVEVVYAGRFQLPETIATIAIDEDVDVVGVSAHSWEFLHYAGELAERLGAAEPPIPVLVGRLGRHRRRPRRDHGRGHRRGRAADGVGGRDPRGLPAPGRPPPGPALSAAAARGRPRGLRPRRPRGSHRIRDMLAALPRTSSAASSSTAAPNVRVGYRGIVIGYPGGGKVELLEPLPGSTFLDSFFARNPLGRAAPPDLPGRRPRRRRPARARRRLRADRREPRRPELARGLRPSARRPRRAGPVRAGAAGVPARANRWDPRGGAGRWLKAPASCWPATRGRWTTRDWEACRRCWRADVRFSLEIAGAEAPPEVAGNLAVVAFVRGEPGGGGGAAAPRDHQRADQRSRRASGGAYLVLRPRAPGASRCGRPRATTARRRTATAAGSSRGSTSPSTGRSRGRATSRRSPT